MNKYIAMKICEQRHLIQKHRAVIGVLGLHSTPSDRYCYFHRDYGHTTDECRHLAEEIEWVIRSDSGMKAITVRGNENIRPPKRSREVKNHNQRRNPEQRRWGPPGPGPNNQCNPPRVPPHTWVVINMISGGPTDGDFNRAQKSNSRNMENCEVRETKARPDRIIPFVP